VKNDRSWIIIRFSQMCGIVLNQTRIQHLWDDSYSFKFSEIDIIDFVVIINCPILDYYSGCYYNQLARKEKIAYTKLTLLKTSISTFENASLFKFPEVQFLYSEAQFEAIKLDCNVVGDWDNILHRYNEKWELNSSPSSAETWDYLCSILWRMFQGKQEYQLKEKFKQLPLCSLREQYPKTQSNPEETKHSSLEYLTLQKEIELHLKTIKEDEMKIKETLLRFILKSDSQTMELKKIDVNHVNPETLKKWMNEIKFWDIKRENKFSFLHLFFNLPELFSLCLKENIEISV